MEQRATSAAFSTSIDVSLWIITRAALHLLKTLKSTAKKIRSLSVMKKTMLKDTWPWECNYLRDTMDHQLSGLQLEQPCLVLLSLCKQFVWCLICPAKSAAIQIPYNSPSLVKWGEIRKKKKKARKRHWFLSALEPCKRWIATPESRSQ